MKPAEQIQAIKDLKQAATNLTDKTNELTRDLTTSNKNHQQLEARIAAAVTALQAANPVAGAPGKTANTNFDYYSGEGSKLMRQLSLAGIAIIWVFRGSTTTTILAEYFFMPLMGFCMALFLDFLMYMIATILAHFYNPFQKIHDLLLNSIYYLKMGAALIAFFMLARTVYTHQLLFQDTKSVTPIVTPISDSTGEPSSL